MKNKTNKTDYKKKNIFQDKRKRTWEMFNDPCYYDMTCVRCISTENAESFNSQLSFHFGTWDKAVEFQKLIEESF